MEKEKIITVALFLLLITLIGIPCVWVAFKQMETYECDIGNPEIIGDYETSAFFLAKYNVFSHSCAVEDCVAFNDYQKSMGGESSCMV